MTGYIALLKGINVGGNNVVKMAELRDELTARGLERVRTYIQSGNILCESPDGSEATVRETVAAALERLLGKPIAVVVRSFEELKRIMAACPYEARTPDEGKRVMLALLAEAIPAERAENALRGGPGEASGDEFTISEREIYFRFAGSVLDSPLGNRMMKLGGTTVTTRNWNTMQKLLEMSRE